MFATDDVRKFSLEITLGNDAMQTHDDIAVALERLAMKMYDGSGSSSGLIRDLNGNLVGSWKIVNYI